MASLIARTHLRSVFCNRGGIVQPWSRSQRSQRAVEQCRLTSRFRSLYHAFQFIQQRTDSRIDFGNDFADCQFRGVIARKLVLPPCDVEQFSTLPILFYYCLPQRFDFRPELALRGFMALYRSTFDRNFRFVVVGNLLSVLQLGCLLALACNA